ncbi:hypothetical protein FACS1894187_15510 [Synergistales bacterium]|nr:hypothetical protein FACS1894187_15510 [Synergistales bacterium]
MIGKHISSPKSNGSFGGLNDYIAGKSKRRSDTEKVAFVDCVNLISAETATTEMESAAHLNKRCGDPVMHLHICVNRVNSNTLKAVNPAHGWTRRGMERAARRIEHAQGWQTENNTWSEVNEQGEIVRKSFSPDNVIPQKVQDMENLTGEQSAIRKAQNLLKDKLKGLSAWEDFYNLLSLNGMKYQKKGSGAVIVIDDVTVKASDVSRNLALSKLEKQLGLYQEIHHLAQFIYGDKSKKHDPKPLDDVNRNNENWNAYSRARTEHKENRERLYMAQQKDKKEL